MRRNNRQDNGPYNLFAEAEITVEFFDCDPLQIVWHGNYFNYFEIGRRKLLEKIGYDYTEMKKTGYAFPVVEASAKYCGPLQFKDRALIRAILVEYENRLKIKYEIRNIQTGFITTRGVTTQMAYNMTTNESCFVCPQILLEKVETIVNVSHAPITRNALGMQDISSSLPS